MKLLRYTLLIILAIFLIVGLIFFNTSSPYDLSKKEIFPFKIKDNLNKPVYRDLNYEATKKFALYHNYIRTRDGNEVPGYDLGYKTKAYARSMQMLRSKATRSAALDWQERGPGNVAGRTRGLWVDPTDDTYSTWLTGSTSGGVWKTQDAGESWQELGQGAFTTLATSVIEGCKADPNQIYVGTGEGFDGLMVVGDGIWKSIDKGNTWEQLASTAGKKEFANIMRIAVNQANPDELVAATRHSLQEEDASGKSYLYKSINGGESWTLTYESDGATVQHVVAHPDNFNLQFASLNRKGILKSVDAGDTWELVYEGSDIGRLELALAPNSQNFIYAAIEGGPTGSMLLYSSDKGITWQTVEPASEVDNFGNWLGGQGWYDNTIAVNPYDSLEVFVGGVSPILRIRVSNETSVDDAKAVSKQNDDYILYDPSFSSSSIENSAGIISGKDLNILTETQWALSEEDLPAINIQIGASAQQMAHFFEGSESSDSPEYKSYLPVNIQAFDSASNQALMLSVFDVNGNGKWDFVPTDEDLESVTDFDDYLDLVEPILIHIRPYDSLQPDDEIKQNLVPQTAYGLFLIYDFISGIDVSEGLPSASIEIINAKIQSGSGGKLTVLTDGYGSYFGQQNVGSKGVHVDHHNLVILPVDDATEDYYILNANDGGVAFSKDRGETFKQTGATFAFGFTDTGNTGDDVLFPYLSGYNVSTFYGADKMNGEDRYVGGTQDNGSWISDADPDPLSPWKPAPSGDGFEAAWNYGNPDLILESSQGNVVFRSEDRGETWQRLELPGGGPFITRIANSKQDPDMVAIPTSEGMAVSFDFGDQWKVTPMPNSWRFSGFDIPTEISLADPAVVWSGTGMTDSRSIAVSNDFASSFQASDNYPQAKLGAISGLATHPTDKNTAYALFSIADGPKVLRTTDLGQTWEDISGFITNVDESNNGYPDVATYSLLVMPYNTDIIWAGTEIGLFESTDGGQSWAYADNGLPPVSIWEMKIVNDEVVVATHGRGIWSVSLPELEGYEPEQPLALVPQIRVDGGFDGDIIGDFKVRSEFDSVFLSVEVDGQVARQRTRTVLNQTTPFSLLEAFSDGSISLPEDTVISAVVTVSMYKDGNTYSSSAQTYVYDVDSESITNYEDDFNDLDADFARLNFTVNPNPGLRNPSLQSLHPYLELADQFSVFQKPILIESEEKSILSFDEIVLVEEGEAGIGYPDVYFYDYVIVEATNDNGKSWQALTEGYDASLHEDWLQYYREFEDPDPSLYKRRSINLADYFEPGSVIYVRFRIFSDPFVTGWGWSIDNLSIGDRTTSLREPTAQASVNLYPNPTSDVLNISYQSQRLEKVNISIMDGQGKLVRFIAKNQLVSERLQLEHDVSALASGVYFTLIRNESGSMISKRFIVR